MYVCVNACISICVCNLLRGTHSPTPAMRMSSGACKSLKLKERAVYCVFLYVCISCNYYVCVFVCGCVHPHYVCMYMCLSFSVQPFKLRLLDELMCEILVLEHLPLSTNGH